MSPYLFNICLEALSRAIHEVCERAEWTPFGVGKKKVSISHLLFADDLLLFGRVDENTAFAVRNTLNHFCEVSGQKINELKSKLIFSPNTQKYFRNLFQDTINVREIENLGTYLGLPISHKRPSRAQVQFVIDKVRARLSTWKTKFLSEAGRLCLITSTLSTIPAYYMQASLLPASTLRDLDSTCNNFLWGDTIEGRKIHLVGKDQICIPKNRGGLGIRAHKQMNIAYMAKLGWKMAQAPPNLAQECIRSKYIHESHAIKFKNGSNLWKNIGMGWALLQENSTWTLGKGTCINLWEDNWLTVGSLRSLIQGPLREGEERIKVEDIVLGGIGTSTHYRLTSPKVLGIGSLVSYLLGWTLRMTCSVLISVM